MYKRYSLINIIDLSDTISGNDGTVKSLCRPVKNSVKNLSNPFSPCGVDGIIEFVLVSGKYVGLEKVRLQTVVAIQMYWL